MRKAEQTYVLDKDYNGYILCTDGKVFFTKDDQNNILFEAKSLEALKTKCRKPKELDIQAVILEPDYFSWRDDEEPAPRRVRVYGVSPTGSFLYELLEDGKKDKTSKHGNRLRVLRTPGGTDEVQQYRDLKNAQIAAKKALEKFLEEWPTMNVKDYLPSEKED